MTGARPFGGAGVSCGATGGAPPFRAGRGAPGVPAGADPGCPWALPGGPGRPGCWPGTDPVTGGDGKPLGNVCPCWICIC